MNEANHNGQNSPARLSFRQGMLWVAAIALIYFATARLSLSLLFVPEGIAAIWQPAGVFLSAILLTRRELRPWLAGTLFLTDFIAEMLAGTPFLISAIHALALTGDAVLSCWLLLRFVGEPITFRRVREVVGWLALSVLLSNALVALVAAAASELCLGTHSFGSSWEWWAASDGVGNLLVTPFILSWAVCARIRLRDWNWQRVFEEAALFIPLALLNIALFGYLSKHKLFALFVPFVTFPFLVWAALHFGVRGVATAMIILAAIAIPFAVSGHVPSFSFAPGVRDDVIVLQLFLAAMAIPALFLAAVVTERKEAEEELRDSEERYRRLFEDALDGIALVDAQTGMILDCNPAMLKLVGRERHEVVGQSQRILHPPSETIGEVTSSFEQHRQEKAGQVLEVPILTKAGEVRTAEIRANVREVQGRKVMVGIFRDVTERKQAEEEMKKQMEELVSWHEVTIGREGRVMELKNEVNELLSKLGQPPCYENPGV